MASAFSEILNDPTRPPESIIKMLPEAMSEQDTTLTLSAVKVDGKRSFAIINGKLVRLGEKLDNYTLVAVNGKQAVLVNKERNKLKLTLDVVDYKNATIKPVKK
ncbi:hypothetical protein [Methylophilus aquaticus]|uniref:MSHA biogenesis protein MshK n=1 Tax=Methylophilus aquaticus TaxID=1971610 RepID=A0ABT9JQ09_9PROT|nr:hypothetical protein [Methylophilus aquaticus]MDP8566647.1 hypothetical protein [Methylophilus aquaticus]